MAVLPIFVVMCGIEYIIFIPELINGYFDTYDTVMCILSAVVIPYFCYLPVSNVWHLLTGRYEYYTEETEVNKFYKLGDKEAEALGIRPDEPVREVTITHTFDLHSHPKRVLTTKETKLRKVEA